MQNEKHSEVSVEAMTAVSCICSCNCICILRSFFRKNEAMFLISDTIAKYFTYTCWEFLMPPFSYHISPEHSFQEYQPEQSSCCSEAKINDSVRVFTNSIFLVFRDWILPCHVIAHIKSSVKHFDGDFIIPVYEQNIRPIKHFDSVIFLPDIEYNHAYLLYYIY